MKLAYLDLIGGASGDMLIGALLDSGLLINNLEAEFDLDADDGEAEDHEIEITAA